MAKNKVFEYTEELRVQDVIRNSGVIMHTKPHAVIVKRVYNGLMLVTTDTGKFAVGRGIRIGTELPHTATLFSSADDADSYFYDKKGSSNGLTQ